MGHAQAVYDRFRRELLARLEPMSDDLTEALREVLDRRFPARVRTMEFRVIEDDLEMDDRFPIVLDLPPDPSKTEELLETRGALCPPEWMAKYEDEDAEGLWRDFAAKIVAEWFAGCWAEAGGAGSTRSAFVVAQDSIRRYDLAARRWVSGDE